MKKTVLHASMFALTLPMSLYAIGLGTMTVKSALDQPFTAEIELIDVGSTPLPGIKVGLADPENFEEIGLERTAILSLLSFKLVRNAQGKFIIMVQSQERMTEPYMEVVVDLTWPKGQLYKAYTVLLDPPGYQLVATTAQSSPTHYKKIKKHIYEPGVINKTIITSVEHNPVELNDNKKKASYGPTVTNENVWQIAQRYKTSEVILPQVVLAIVGANPEAFKDGNLNGLNVGVRLVIPATKEILQIPADLATQEIMAHDKSWNEKTAIIHVLTPPYMNGDPVSAAPPVKRFQIPVIPQQMIPLDTALPVIHSNQLQTAPNNTQPLSSEHYSTTKAELSITTAAVESVRESNALLMEQLHLLQEQNKKLQQQLEKREKQLENIRSQMDVLVKERLAVAAQANSINSSGSSLGYWPLFLLLIAAAGGGGYAYWHLRRRAQEKNKASPYLIDSTKEPQSFAPLVEPTPLKTDEALVGSSSDSEPTKQPEKEAKVDACVNEHEFVAHKMDASADETGPDKESVISHVESDLVIAPTNDEGDTELVSFESINEEEKVTPDEHTDAFLIDEPSTEDDSSTHDVLEFESGLHELIAEKTSTQQDNTPTNDEMDMGLDFVSPLDESVNDMENKVAVKKDKDELIRLEDTEAHQELSIEFESNNFKPDSSNIEPQDPGLEQSITEFFAETVDESNGDEGTLYDTQAGVSVSLKSTKALNTLLELAITYLGMDDFESARHSLDEVLEFGSETQKEEARRLLAQINDRI